MLLSERVLKVLIDSPMPMTASEIARQLHHKTRAVAMACQQLGAHGKITVWARCKPMKYSA